MNDLIYQKFNKSIVIDKEKIKEILQKPQKSSKELYLRNSFMLIIKMNLKINMRRFLDIKNIGFKTAYIHSSSDTAANGVL